MFVRNGDSVKRKVTYYLINQVLIIHITIRTYLTVTDK